MGLDRRMGPQSQDIVVRVHPAAGTTNSSVAAHIEKLRALEHERAQEEGRMFREVAAEMNGLVGLFVTELQAQIDKQFNSLRSARPGLSFLQACEADSWVLPADIAYPTAETPASDMERRRDTAEALVRARLTMEKLSLLQAANALAKEKLDAVIGVVGRSMK